MLKPSIDGKLPGTFRTRVFVGGSYARDNRRLLDGLSQAIRECGFNPIIADEFELKTPGHDIHDATMWLLHSCRLAVFEVSELSGALMEIERLADYGTHKALLLYHHRAGRAWTDFSRAWRTSQMLQSLAREQDARLRVSVYNRPREAFEGARRFLTAVRRSLYGKLHGL